MTETWDEAVPAGSRNPKLGDDDIRSFKTAMRERLAIDHEFAASESPAYGASGSVIGMHKKITLTEQASDPTTTTNQVAIYAKDDSGAPAVHCRPQENGTAFKIIRKDGQLNPAILFGAAQAADPSTGADEAALFFKDDGAGQLELFARDESNGSVIQLTVGLNPSIPSGETVLFEKDTAVAGYTVQTDFNDGAVYITKGTAASGEEGGTEKTGGTWTQPDHAHSMADHAHTVSAHRHRWYDSKGSASHDATWDSAGSAVDVGVTTTKSNYAIQVSNSSVTPPDRDWYTEDGGNGNTGDAGAGNTGNAATAGTWRPPGINFTRQTRN